MARNGTTRLDKAYGCFVDGRRIDVNTASSDAISCGYLHKALVDGWGVEKDVADYMKYIGCAPESVDPHSPVNWRKVQVSGFDKRKFDVIVANRASLSISLSLSLPLSLCGRV